MDYRYLFEYFFWKNKHYGKIEMKYIHFISDVNTTSLDFNWDHNFTILVNTFTRKPNGQVSDTASLRKFGSIWKPSISERSEYMTQWKRYIILACCKPYYYHVLITCARIPNCIFAFYYLNFCLFYLVSSLVAMGTNGKLSRIIRWYHQTKCLSGTTSKSKISFVSIWLWYKR